MEAAKEPDLELARQVAWWLDDVVTIPGTRVGVGLDAVIGLVPGVGDGLGVVLSGVVLGEAVKQGVPGEVLARMILNLLVDSLLGVVPVVGDLLDVAHRANRRNMQLLQEAIADPHRTRHRSRVYVLVASMSVVLTLALLVALAALAIWGLVQLAVQLS